MVTLTSLSSSWWLQFYWPLAQSIWYTLQLTSSLVFNCVQWQLHYHNRFDIGIMGGAYTGWGQNHHNISTHILTYRLLCYRISLPDDEIESGSIDSVVHSTMLRSLFQTKTSVRITTVGVSTSARTRSAATNARATTVTHCTTTGTTARKVWPHFTITYHIWVSECTVVV